MMTSPAPSTAIELLNVATLAPIRSGRIAWALENVIVRRIIVWATGGEIDDDITCPVDRDRAVECRDVGADRSTGDVALRHHGRSIGIADVDLKPMDQGHAGSDRLHLGHAVEESVGVNYVADPVIDRIQQEARSLLLDRIGSTLIDIAETDGADGPERARRLIVGL